MNPIFVVLSLVLTASIVCGQITPEMQKRFETQITDALKKRSIEDFYLCCSWEGLSDDDTLRMKSDREEIFARMLQIGPNVTLIFHDPVSSVYKKINMRKHLQGKSQWVPTPPAEMFVEIRAKAPRSDSLLLPVTILHGELKHISWIKE